MDATPNEISGSIAASMELTGTAILTHCEDQVGLPPHVSFPLPPSLGVLGPKTAFAHVGVAQYDALPTQKMHPAPPLVESHVSFLPEIHEVHPFDVAQVSLCTPSMPAQPPHVHLYCFILKWYTLSSVYVQQLGHLSFAQHPLLFGAVPSSHV